MRGAAKWGCHKSSINEKEVKEREQSRGNERKSGVSLRYTNASSCTPFSFFLPLSTLEEEGKGDPPSLSRRNIQCMVFVTPGMLCSSPFSRVLHSSLIPLPALHAHIPSPLLYFSPTKTLSFSCFFYTKLMLTTKVSVFIFLQKIYYVLVNNQKEHFRVLVNFDLFLMPYNCTMFILDYRGH
jgi:hypothetical protein